LNEVSDLHFVKRFSFVVGNNSVNQLNVFRSIQACALITCCHGAISNFTSGGIGFEYCPVFNEKRFSQTSCDIREVLAVKRMFF
jgi:hypothetical protein